MIISKMMYKVSLICSWFYGFTILLILDMINRKPYFNTVFRHPSDKGIIMGIISFVIYSLLILALIFISKANVKRFILINAIVFIIALVLFCFIGVIFFINTDTGP